MWLRLRLDVPGMVWWGAARVSRGMTRVCFPLQLMLFAGGLPGVWGAVLTPPAASLSTSAFLPVLLPAAERTIRFHYANCSTFNADFDGDEINLHLPQVGGCGAASYRVALRRGLI